MNSLIRCFTPLLGTLLLVSTPLSGALAWAPDGGELGHDAVLGDFASPLVYSIDGSSQDLIDDLTVIDESNRIVVIDDLSATCQLAALFPDPESDGLLLLPYPPDGESFACPFAAADDSDAGSVSWMPGSELGEGDPKPVRRPRMVQVIESTLPKDSEVLLNFFKTGLTKDEKEKRKGIIKTIRIVIPTGKKTTVIEEFPEGADETEILYVSVEGTKLITNPLEPTAEIPHPDDATRKIAVPLKRLVEK